jgi:hypothetical protein
VPRTDQPGKFSSHCKTCLKTWNKNYRGSPGHKKSLKKYKDKHPARLILYAARHNARIGGYEPPDIAEKELDVLLANPDRCCALPSCQTKKNLCLDHCHKTGKVRGFLCDTHNRAIGLLADNVKLLQESIMYLLGSNPVTI